MPGSERITDPMAAGPEKRAYVAALAAVLLFVLCLGLFNIVVNPLGAFGPLRSHRFDNVTPRETYSEIRRLGAFGFYRALAKSVGAKTVLIGTSRVLLGFDICAYPHMARMAAAGMGMSGTARMVRLVMTDQKAPAALLIELPRPGPPHAWAPDEPVHDKLRAAFSPVATYLSFRTVEASLNRGAGYRPGDRRDCKATPPQTGGVLRAPTVAPPPQDLADFNRFRLTYRQELAALLDEAEAICHREHLRHRLRFFALPLVPHLERFPALKHRLQQNQRIVQSALAAPRPYKGSCDISYVDYSITPPKGQERFWTDAGLWISLFHFSPTLGALGLKALAG